MQGVTIKSSSTSDTATVVTIRGFDEYGVAMSESADPRQNGSTSSVASPGKLKAFATVTIVPGNRYGTGQQPLALATTASWWGCLSSFRAAPVAPNSLGLDHRAEGRRRARVGPAP